MIHEIDPATATKIEFALVNRNFAHYPIIRPPSVAPTWRASPSGKRCTWELHHDPRSGRPRIVLTLPTEAFDAFPEFERGPNRYDMDVLLRLTAMTALMQREERHQTSMHAGRQAIKTASRDRKHLLKLSEAGLSVRDIGSDAYSDASWKAEAAGEVTLRFRSLRCLLACLDRDPDQTSNRASVRRSLWFWYLLKVRNRAWSAGNEHHDRRYAPFIELLEMPDEGHGEVLVKLSSEYMATVGRDSSNYVKMHFPLVTASDAAFNMSLFLPTFVRAPNLPRTCPTYDLTQLCDKLGIAGGNAPEIRRALKSALVAVNSNFEIAHPNKLQYEVEFPTTGQVRFVRDTSKAPDPPEDLLEDPEAEDI